MLNFDLRPFHPSGLSHCDSWPYEAARSLQALFCSLPNLRHLGITITNEQPHTLLFPILFGRLDLLDELSPPGNNASQFYTRLQSIDLRIYSPDLDTDSNPFAVFVSLLRRASRLAHLKLFVYGDTGQHPISDILSLVCSQLTTLSIDVGPEYLDTIIMCGLETQTQLKTLLSWCPPDDLVCGRNL